MPIARTLFIAALIASVCFLFIVYEAHAQVVPAQNQVITAPYGQGYVVSTSTSPTHKLGTALIDLAGSFVTGILNIARGGTGTSTPPGLGQVLVGNALGGYDYVATSTFGGGGGTNYWTLSGSDLFNNSGTNVGIGTTTPAVNLHVFSSGAGATARIDTQSSTGNALLSLVDVNTSGNTSNYFQVPSGAANANLATIPLSGGVQVGVGGTGGFVFNVRANAPIIFGTGGNAFANERMRITGTGLVGIGTSTPTSLLNISGSDAGTTLTAASAAMFDITNSNSTDNNFSDVAFSTKDAAGNTVVTSKIAGVNTVHTTSATSGDLAFLTRSAGTITEKMRILANGNVGIGSTSPYAKLSVTGNAIFDSNNAEALVVGPTGTTNPTFRVDSSTASGITGLSVVNSISIVTLNAISPSAAAGITLAPKGNSSFTVLIAAANKLVASNTTNTYANTFHAFAGVANTNIATRFSVTNPADTSLSASTEAIYTYFNLGTSVRSHATGALATQRDFRISGTTHAFTAASTLTNLAALSVDPGQGGNNATVTNNMGIYLPTKSVANSTNSYGLFIEQYTGATNNYAAYFGGNVGIGSTSPGSLLSIGGDGTGTNFFDNATTTKSGVGGYDIASGCYSVAGVCIGGSSGVTSVTGTYPIISSGGTTPAISLAFGTTTSNTWAGTQTFTNAPILSSLSGLLQGNGSSAVTAVTGTAGQFPYYNGTNTLIATSSIFMAANGNVGIGTTSPYSPFSLDVASSTDNNSRPFTIRSIVAGINYVFQTFDRWGHPYVGGTTPSISPGAVTGTDSAFKAVPGASSFTINFSHPWDSTPICVATPSGVGSRAQVTSVSTTQVAISSTSGGDTVYVICTAIAP